MNGIIGELPGLDEAAEMSSARHFYRELARFGLTSVGDLAGGGHTYPAGYAATLAMAEAGEMAMRISNFLPPQEAERELEILRGFTDRYALNVNLALHLEHAFTIEGAGEALDLSFYDFENFMAPRPDLPPRGETDAQLQAIVQHLLQARWPIRVHATYDETIGRMMDVFEAAHAAERDAGRSGFDGIRWAVEHAETIRPGDHRPHRRTSWRASPCRIAWPSRARSSRTATAWRPPPRPHRSQTSSRRGCRWVWVRMARGPPPSTRGRPSAGP